MLADRLRVAYGVSFPALPSALQVATSRDRGRLNLDPRLMLRRSLRVV